MEGFPTWLALKEPTQSFPANGQPFDVLWGIFHTRYCWWLKSYTTWDVWKPINNGINYQPQLVFSPDFSHQQYEQIRCFFTVQDTVYRYESNGVDPRYRPRSDDGWPVLGTLENTGPDLSVYPSEKKYEQWPRAPRFFAVHKGLYYPVRDYNKPIMRIHIKKISIMECHKGFDHCSYGAYFDI